MCQGEGLPAGQPVSRRDLGHGGHRDRHTLDSLLCFLEQQRQFTIHRVLHEAVSHKNKRQREPSSAHSAGEQTSSRASEGSYEWRPWPYNPMGWWTPNVVEWPEHLQPLYPEATKQPWP